METTAAPLDRGSILVRSLLGIALGVIVTAAAVFAGNKNLFVIGNGVQSNNLQTGVQELRSFAQNDSSNAIAVFIPAKDVFGATNTVAFGTPGSTGQMVMPGTSAHAFDTYTRTLGDVSMDEVYFNSSSGVTVYRYHYRNPTTGQAMCGSGSGSACTASTLQTVRTFPNVTSFTAAYFTVPNLPAIDPAIATFAAANPGDLKDVTILTGYSSDVISGNRLVFYNAGGSVDRQSLSEQVQLVAGAPLSKPDIGVAYSPPPMGAIAENPTPITLGYRGAHGLPTSQTIAVWVPYYHHGIVFSNPNSISATLTSVGSAFTASDVTGTAIVSGSVASLVRGADTATSNPPCNPSGTSPFSYAGTWACITLAATNVGAVNAQFSTQSGLLPPDDVVSSLASALPVTVEGQIVLNPSSITLYPSNYSWNNSAPIQVTEAGYDGTWHVRNAQLSGECNYSTNYATVSSSTLSAATQPGSFDVNAASNTGSCQVEVQDEFGTTDQTPLTVTVETPMPNTWPPAVQYPQQGYSVSPCGVNQPRAFKGSGFGTVLKNATDPYGSGISTDANGCMQRSGGSITDMTSNASVIVDEPGYPSGYNYKMAGSTCGPAVLLVGWTGSGARQGAIISGQSEISGCGFALADQSGAVATNGQNTVAASVVNACSGICFAEAVGQWWKYDNSSSPLGCGNNNCTDYYFVDEVYKYDSSTGTWTGWQNRLTPTYNSAGKQDGCATVAYKSGFTSNVYTGNSGEADYPHLTWTPTSSITYGESALPASAVVGCQYEQGSGSGA